MAEQPVFTAQERRDLKMVYGVFDTSGGGLIDTRDLHKALKILGFKVSRRSAQEMARDVDVRGSLAGQVDLEGFVQIVSKLQGSSYDHYEEIMQAFGYIDKDGDEYLSLEDLTKACSEAGLKLTKTELKGMLEEADCDGDGKISSKEFVQIMQKTNLFK